MTNAVSLGAWLDESLQLMYRANNRPAQLALGSGGSGLTTALASDNTCTLNGTEATVIAPSVIEVGEELMLVTAVSNTTPPVYTLARAYAGTSLQTHTVADPVLVAPDWPRATVRRNLLRGIEGALATSLPCVKTAVISPTINQYYVPAPADCIRPLSMAYVQTDLQGIVKRWEEMTEWEYRDGVDPSISASGALLTVPPMLVTGNLTGFETVQTLYLTYQAPYVWSGGGQEPAAGSAGEVETLAWRPYAQDLPPLYAAAFGLTGRQVARVQVDKVEYFNNEVNFRQGVDQKIGMATWQRFYQRLEECQKLDRSRDPKHRPYRRMHRTSAGTVGF